MEREEDRTGDEAFEEEASPRCSANLKVVESTRDAREVVKHLAGHPGHPFPSRVPGLLRS
jgi:hypothetical protein